MHITLTANQLAGRATGALFFTGFGTLWFALALYVRQSLNAVTICAVAGGALLLLAAASVLYRQARSFPRVADDPAIGRAFGRVQLRPPAHGRVCAFGHHGHHRPAHVSAGAALPIPAALRHWSAAHRLGHCQHLCRAC